MRLLDSLRVRDRVEDRQEQVKAALLATDRTLLVPLFPEFVSESDREDYAAEHGGEGYIEQMLDQDQERELSTWLAEREGSITADELEGGEWV